MRPGDMVRPLESPADCSSPLAPLLGGALRYAPYRVFYASRTHTASSMKPSGPSQKTA
jgi:hypothetical protein